jgi:hypothetical protein
MAIPMSAMASAPHAMAATKLPVRHITDRPT